MPWLVLRMLALKSWLSSRTKTLTTKPVRVGIFAFVVSFLFRAAPAHAISLDTDLILQSFAEFAYSIAATITKLIVLLIDAMVPIMTYNNFVGNPVVKAGWAIVRDTVNMFFVVILIIIAFGTIFGAEKFKWQQQVPRLLIFAIVINFSKTLCGIMIDFGQVIMLTFANALREIAAGNFIQLLGLNQIYSVSQSSSIITSIQKDGGQGASQAFDFFASGIASVLLTLWVLATLVIMVAILLFRIIMLWVLVVIAPLAWFVGGARDIIKSKAYDDWWDEFKCLVGIGPILAFFLWLTLAVAGAGNIAANSGFDVSATSNNADFTSSLLERNNFLSFLIGMAMLYAGLKAASQFCSAAKTSTSLFNKVAGLAKRATLTVGGLGLKVGGVGARLGARGLAATPGALAAGSRYLPPVVRNIPRQINPLNAQRRAALSGKVGGALGDNAVGRYFKGKQADLVLSARAAKFGGVNKEKEAMKDKSRDWKKGQIESMLKSPPGTQAGQDAMTALLEEVMADKRLQKDLGRDKVQELWKSQGAKYKDMAKGNAVKSADLESFEKANADFTGSTHLIKDADDTKNLAAGAWQDNAVQDRASRIQTTFKKEGRALSALEAAREGFYGVEAQKAAVKGTKVDTLGLGEEMEKQFALALTHEDKESAEKVVAQIETKYKDAGTSDQDREKMARSMDRMRAAAAEMGKGSDSKATTANDVLASFDAKRKGMEVATASFGLPPAPKAGESADEYVDKHFSQASGERIDAAMSQIDTEKTSTQGAVSALETELQALKGVEQQVADKEKQIAEVRKRIAQSVEGDRKQAYQPLRRARKDMAVAQQRGNAKEIAHAQKRLTEAQTTYDAVVKEGDEEMKSSPDLTALETEIEQIISAAGGQAGLDEVKKKSSKLRELQAQADRLQQTRDRLAQEKAKRTT